MVKELLFQQDDRFALEIKHHDIWKMYELQRNAFWLVKEVDLSKDREYFEKLDNNHQHFIKMILAFFAASDNIVNMNLSKNFIDEVQLQEAQIAYRFQAAMEDIHSETYSLLIKEYIRDNKEKEYLLNAIQNIDCIKKKANWAIKWIDTTNMTETEKEESFSTRLIAFLIVEGIFFSGSFCAIYWLSHNKHKLPGLITTNEFIARDEGLHCSFAALLYNRYINNRLPQNKIYDIFKEAVEIESDFICNSLKCRLIGMNSDLMIQYIKYIADYWLAMIGYNKLYNVENPFGFMEQISMQNKTNFFEADPTEYQRANISDIQIDWNSNEECDF